MDNKYYTPEIEEFHEGFKYEQYNKHQDEWYEEVWDAISEFGDSKLYHLNVEECRVKYLDREDIESLGGVHDYNFEPIPNRDELPVYEGYLFDKQETPSGELWILYHFPDNVVWIDYTKKCAGEGYVFKGEIKNKSELKKVLKMIGYE